MVSQCYFLFASVIAFDQGVLGIECALKLVNANVVACCLLQSSSCSWPEVYLTTPLCAILITALLQKYWAVLYMVEVDICVLETCVLERQCTNTHVYTNSHIYIKPYFVKTMTFSNILSIQTVRWIKLQEWFEEFFLEHFDSFYCNLSPLKSIVTKCGNKYF